MRHTILILDDNASFAETLAHVLSHNGFITEWTNDSQQVHVLAAKVRPDALIVDYGLGFQRGTEVACSLVNDQLVDRVILLTGRTEITQQQLPSELQRCALLLYKPVEIDLLISALRRLLAT